MAGMNEDDPYQPPQATPDKKPRRLLFGRIARRGWLRQLASESVCRYKSLLVLVAVTSAMIWDAEGLAQQVPILGTTGARDPAPLVRDGNTYYYYSTGQGILARSSTDMSHWSNGPAIFSTPPSWTTQDVPGFSGTFWAPDVEYFNGLYHLYYAVSTFGSQVSAIGMATSPTLNPSDANYAWIDHGPVIESRSGSAYNTIDPSVVTRPDGSMWMSFGSYWTGIYQEQLNPSTGMLLNPNSAPIHLAQRAGSDTSIEASYQYYRGGYYYLFTNWSSGTTYNVRMGRSTSVNGPFVDQAGVALLNGGGTLFLSPRGNYLGPGQVGIYSENGKDYVSYFYNAANNGVDTYALQNLYWTSDNWPTTFQPLVWNAQTTGPAQDGSGTWDLTNTHFLFGSTNQTWNNSGYGAITFGSNAGPAGTVTLAQNVNVGAITFNPASSGNYTIAGGGFSMNIATGCAITANVDATIQSAIVSAGDLIVSGNGNLLLSGNCSYTGSTTVAGGDLTVNGQINSTSNLFLQLGRVTIASVGTVTTAGYTSVGQMIGNSGTLTVNGGLTVNGDLNIGDTSATGTMTVSSGATVRAVTLYVGKFGTANGTITQAGGTVSSLPGALDWRIGGGISSADSAAVGLYQFQGGILNVGANFQVGAYGNGTLTQTGGRANVTGYLAIGRFGGGVGLYDMSSGNGVLTALGQPYLIVGEQGTGTLLVGGSSTVNANTISLAHNGGTGTITQTGGTVNAVGGILFGTDNTGGAGTYKLDGGLLVAGSLARVSGTSILNFSGGTLRAAASNATFLQGLTTATVQAGGANIDTSGQNITIAQPLLHDAAAPAIDGGLAKIGAGTLTLTGSNTYTGGTTINNGTLTTTATGTFGNGPLAVNAATAITSVVNLGNSQIVGALSGTLSGTGSARVNVAAGKTLTVNQTSNTTFGGTVALSSGAAAGTGGGLAKSGGGALEIDGGLPLGNNSTVTVSGGTLRLNIVSGLASVGSGVAASVTGSAILELAGSDSALGTAVPANRVAIANTSNAAAGLLVSSGNQQVGSIDGNGNTQINAGSDLTANHILQSALIIGGAAGSPADVTIEASDASGNPLLGGLSGSLTPTSPFGITGSSSDKISPAVGDGLNAATPPSSSGGSNTTGEAAVPEPTGLILFAIGGLAVGAAAVCRRYNDQTNRGRIGSPLPARPTCEKSARVP